MLLQSFTSPLYFPTGVYNDKPMNPNVNPSPGCPAASRKVLTRIVRAFEDLHEGRDVGVFLDEVGMWVSWIEEETCLFRADQRP